MRRATLMLMLAGVSLILQLSPATRAGQSPSSDVGALAGPGANPILSDHHYRASGAVRPLVLFWIGRDNVKGARITRRRADDGTLGFEMLTGSDPARAPFGTNRWGYIREVVNGDQAELVSVKSETDEESIEEARANVNKKEASRVLVFIREHVTAREATAWSTVADVGREVSYRDLEFVLGRMTRLENWRERRLARPPDARPGFLTAFNELMETTVRAWTSAGGSKARSPKALVYVHRAKLYDLKQDEVELIGDFDAGAHGRIRALRGRFRIRSHETGATSGEFTVIYGVAGELAAVPLRMIYQPRWWLRTELTVDEATDFSAAVQ